MKFQFKLKAIKKHHKILKDLAQKEFIEAQENLQKKLNEINSYYQQVDKTREFIEIQKNNGVGSSILDQAEEYITGLDFKIKTARYEAREKMAVVEEKQEILFQRHRDQKMIDRLEAQHYEAFKKERNKKEQKLIDERAVQFYSRQQEP